MTTHAGNGQVQFRVWPDGTVQEVEPNVDPYPWMSDDYSTIWATDETEALAKAQMRGVA